MTTMDRPCKQIMSEDALDIPLNRISPETLKSMIEEFVTREWTELADSECTLDEKVDQVMQQLKNNQAKIVYDSMSETWNIIPASLSSFTPTLKGS